MDAIQQRIEQLEMTLWDFWYSPMQESWNKARVSLFGCSNRAMEYKGKPYTLRLPHGQRPEHVFDDFEFVGSGQIVGING